MSALEQAERAYAEAESRLGVSPQTFDELALYAAAIAEAKRAEIDAHHAASHGRSTLRYGTVERRRGYRGRTVCLDCYYGR